MEPSAFFTIADRQTPILAFALHDGHIINDGLRSSLQLGEQERAREEDPYTGYMIKDLPVITVIVHRSRFALDLNRTKEKAIYQKPEDAWGLHVWKDLPPPAIEELYRDYDFFYGSVAKLIENAISRHGYFFILDVHSYNHRRESALKEADSATHPEVNMGTAFNKSRWQHFCDSYTQWLCGIDVMGHKIDARQNVIFKGGAFAQWVTGKFGEQGAVFSIEFKKTFMDEWTGIADIPHIMKLKELLTWSVDFLQKEIKQLIQKEY